MSPKLRYDPDVDVLSIAKVGEKEEVIEVYPGLNVEKDSARGLIGVEVPRASRLLEEVIEPLMTKADSG